MCMKQSSKKCYTQINLCIRHCLTESFKKISSCITLIFWFVIYTPLKLQKNVWFMDISRGYRNGVLGLNGLIWSSKDQCFHHIETKNDEDIGNLSERVIIGSLSS